MKEELTKNLTDAQILLIQPLGIENDIKQYYYCNSSMVKKIYIEKYDLSLFIQEFYLSSSVIEYILFIEYINKESLLSAYPIKKFKVNEMEKLMETIDNFINILKYQNIKYRILL